eukprot:GHRQ01005974.1.p1 GENE.GHRQ01005974.1~~GHRQ01005974.1.p1  ORF type:complete len:115 (-),score=7.42 GHRQ01005974.1:4-348(-)
MSAWQYACSSPCVATHSSLNRFVSGQAQHIFFLGFSTSGAAAGSAALPNFHQDMPGKLTVETYLMYFSSQKKTHAATAHDTVVQYVSSEQGRTLKVQINVSLQVNAQHPVAEEP